METANSNTVVAQLDRKSMFKTTVAVGWSFFLMGLVLGNWAALIPAIAVIYNLNDAVLGAILVPAVFGALCAAPLVSLVIMKYGSRMAVASGCVVLICLTIVLGIPSNIGVLIVGIVFLGFGLGWCDTSANHQAVICEKWARKSKLGLFHAIYAIGGLIGVLYGGTLLQFNTPLLYVFIYLAAGTIVPTMFVARWTFTHEEEKEIECRDATARNDEETAVLGQQAVGIDGPITDDDVHLGDIEFADGSGDVSGYGHQGGGGGTIDQNVALRNRNEESAAAESNEEEDKVLLKVPIDYCRLALVAGLGFLAYLGEGSVGDWSTVFLTNNLKAEPIIGTLGFAFFQLVVAIGRLSLDWLVMWIDRKRLLQAAGIVAAMGLGVVGFSPSLSEPNIIPVAIFGFTLCGAGLSVVAPIMISFAGSTIKGMDPAQAIALVTSMAYVGVLVGPPLLGGLALGLGGLRFSLLLDGLFMTFISVVATMLPPSNGRKVSNPDAQ